MGLSKTQMLRAKGHLLSLLGKDIEDSNDDNCLIYVGAGSLRSLTLVNATGCS